MGKKREEEKGRGENTSKGRKGANEMENETLLWQLMRLWELISFTERGRERERGSERVRNWRIHRLRVNRIVAVIANDVRLFLLSRS